MTVTIRPYRASDLAACRLLWAELTQRHRDIYEDQTIGGDDPGAHFDGYLGNPNLRGPWVAEVDGEVVGLTGLELDGEEATLEPAIVTERFRSHGVGRQLVARVRAEARKLGARYLNARPVGRNVEALHFFIREGFGIAGYIELFEDLEPEKGRTWKDSDEHPPGLEIHGRRVRY